MGVRQQVLKTAFAIAAVTSLAGCDLEYWWSRGQPPSTAKILAKSEQRFEDNIRFSDRQDVKGDATQIREALRAANQEISQGHGGARLQGALAKVNTTMSGLEGKISWGSRAPYGELIGQLQGFQSQADTSGTVDKNVFSLYSARTLFFLANELTVPAPVLVKDS